MTLSRRDFNKAVLVTAAAPALGCSPRPESGDTAAVAPSAPTPTAAPTSHPRSVTEVITSESKLEGAGFPVRRPFPTKTLRHVDPFILLDEAKATVAPGKAKGAPDHPHRGFETVAYLLKGKVEHKDSLGNRVLVDEGNVMWMTAGAGIIHSEMPPPRLVATGGDMHGFQIWVNLPSRLKFTQPGYQVIAADTFPVGASPDGRASVKVVAGVALGVQGHVVTKTPLQFQHWTLRPQARVQHLIPRSYNGMVYVFGGSMRVAGKVVSDGQLALLGPGETVELAATTHASGNAEALVLAGEPHNEPIVQYGPFVMNTRAEIRQAFADYRAGKMGRISI